MARYDCNEVYKMRAQLRRSFTCQVSCGLCSDPSAEPEPDKVTRYWKEEFDALYDEVMAFDGGKLFFLLPISGEIYVYIFTIVLRYSSTKAWGMGKTQVYNVIRGYFVLQSIIFLLVVYVVML